MLLRLSARARVLALALLFQACASAPPAVSPAPTAAAPATAVSPAAPAAVSTAVPPVVPTEPLHLIVLHTNDVHGQVLPVRPDRPAPGDAPGVDVGGLPRVAGYVAAVREEARRTGAEVLVVDAGDWFQGTPEGQIDRGLPLVEVLSRVGYDALAVGNHDLDHGVANLVRILEATGLPAVCANLADPATHEHVPWAAPWRVVERGGLRIGIVGLLTPDTPVIGHPDTRALEFAAPAEALARAQAELAGEVDWILPVTHLGVGADRALARAHPDLDLVVGGHSHTLLERGEREGTTLIVQTGAKAAGVGRVDLWLDRGTHEVERSEAQVVRLDREVPESFRDAEVEELCRALVAKSEERMSAVVGELTSAAERGREPFTSWTAGNLIADAFRAHTGADVAMMNRGGIRKSLAAGKVTRRDVFELLPFDNHLVTLTLTGAELADCLRKAVEGRARSGIEVSGAVIELSVDAENRGTFLGARIGSAALDPAASYRVTVNSFMAEGGDAFLAPGVGTDRLDEPVLMRDVLEDFLAAQHPLSPSAENRYERTGP